MELENVKWIFIGLLLGSTVTSTHETYEACLGRMALLRGYGVVGSCQSETIPNKSFGVCSSETKSSFMLDNGTCPVK